MTPRTAITRLCAALALFALAPQGAAAQESYGPRDEASEGGWSGEAAVSATYADRTRDLVSDYERKGFGLDGSIAYTLPAGKSTTLKLEASAGTDRYTTSYGARAEIEHHIGKAVSLRVTASGTKHAVVLESLDADQASVQAAVAVKAGAERIEAYARHRWRKYNDFAATQGDRTGEGWQVGARWRHRFGSYHWFNVHTAWDRIYDNGGRHSYRRTTVSLDYSHPIGKRLRVLAGADYRDWTYDGRRVGDVATAPRRSDYLVRPELGLSWGKTTGLYARATAGYDIYRSNDLRFTGDGPRLRAVLGFRF